MPPEQRKLHVRGILCMPCNVSLRYRIDVTWLQSATKYLEKFAAKGL